MEFTEYIQSSSERKNISKLQVLVPTEPQPDRVKVAVTLRSVLLPVQVSKGKKLRPRVDNGGGAVGRAWRWWRNQGMRPKK